MCRRYVDVRDVAKAHVLAMESADIESARHILQGYNAVPLKHVVDRIKEFYPDYKKQLPSKDFTGKVGSFVIKHIFSRIQSKQTGVYIRTNLNKAYNPDSSKLKGLGLEYYAFEDTLRYTIEWALGTGLVEFSPTANL
jgi:nucleoside-diphosphate-sugar epimerase